MLVSRYWYKSIFDRVAPIPILRGPGPGSPRRVRDRKTHAGTPKLAADITQLPKRSRPNVSGQKLAACSPLAASVCPPPSFPIPIPIPKPSLYRVPTPIPPYIACSATVLNVNRSTIMRLWSRRSAQNGSIFAMTASMFVRLFSN